MRSTIKGKSPGKKTEKIYEHACVELGKPKFSWNSVQQGLPRAGSRASIGCISSKREVRKIWSHD